MIIGIIKKTFITRDKKVLMKLYKGLVRPHLEYCVQAWRPNLKKDVELMEKVQRRVTKMVTECRGLEYEKRLERLGLTTREVRRARGDLIIVFQLIE